MTTAIKRRRGTTSQHSTFTGLEGEITVDTTKETLVVHDGATAGGFPLAKESGSALSPSSVTLSGGTANGVTYLNGSKVLTSGSALVFDGTNLGVGTSSPAQKLEVSTTSGPYQMRLGDGAVSAVYTYDIGRSSVDGYFRFYGNQTGANGYIFGGINGERMRLDFSGNLGLGVTPSAWPSTYRALQIGTRTALYQNDAGNPYLASNAYDNGTIRYSTSNPAALFGVESGNVFKWYQAPSGTAGNAITLTQAMTLDASGNLGVGIASPTFASGNGVQINNTASADARLRLTNAGTGTGNFDGFDLSVTSAGQVNLIGWENQPMTFLTNATERARIDSSGNLLVGGTSYEGSTTSGASSAYIGSNGFISANVTGDFGMQVNRTDSDGVLFNFRRNGGDVGNISVSGTTVSYNGGHLARFSQLTSGLKDASIVKGTLLSNLDEMNIYKDVDGNPVINEQLNKVKVSDVEGDADVAGVFVSWIYDESHNVDEINMAMTGDMIIRIAQGVTVARGDLLMSAGDGTAKPQGDDIVRSKTVAKVTSTHVTCTYADGSFCVPCVLMAC